MWTVTAATQEGLFVPVCGGELGPSSQIGSFDLPASRSQKRTSAMTNDFNLKLPAASAATLTATRS